MEARAPRARGGLLGRLSTEDHNGKRASSAARAVPRGAVLRAASAVLLALALAMLLLRLPRSRAPEGNAAAAAPHAAAPRAAQTEDDSVWDAAAHAAQIALAQQAAAAEARQAALAALAEAKAAERAAADRWAAAAAKRAASTPPPQAPPDENALRPLPPLSRDLLEQHSNEIPGQPCRVVVSIYSDFTPGTNQAVMLLNWVRTMHELRMHCVVAVCQTGNVSLETLQPLLRESGGWCGAFDGSPLAACAVNPKVGRWHYVQRILSYGFDSLTSDADIAWLRNPLPYFGSLLAAHPAADVLSSTDSNDGHYLAATLGNGTRLYSLVRTRLPRPAPPVPPAVVARRWEVAFPAFPLPGDHGVVRKPELANTDDRLGPAQLLAALRTGRALPDGGEEVVDLGLEEISNCGGQFNTGIMLWRATPAARALLDKSVEVMSRPTSVPIERVDDQRPINIAMRFHSRACAWDELGEDGEPLSKEQAEAACSGDPLLHAVWAGKACMGLLPVVQFANGFVYTAMRAHEQYGVQPFAFHATYSADKLMKLREEGVFRDAPERWTEGPPFRPEPGGKGSRLRVLAYDVALPRELLFPPLINGELSPWSHVALVQHQLGLLRSALAIAHVLGRAIQLPRMACSCECFYFVGKNCTIEGHRMRLPYVCPTDHWLQKGGAYLGVPYVEPGFLEAPARPAAARASVARVRLCGGAADPPCGDAAALATTQGSGQVALLPRGADAAAVRAALGAGAAADALELRLESAAGAWGGFGDAAAETAFRERIAKALSGWCCFHNSSNGVLFNHLRRDVTQFQINYRWDWNGTNSEVVPHGEGMESGACAA